jgi:spermidine/putrescine transport system permease protein
MNNTKRQLLAGPYLIWIIGFILLPIGFVLYYALTSQAAEFTFQNIIAIVSPINRNSLFLSLRLAFLCTAICLILSYPLAMVLKNLRNKYQNLIVFIFILPMWMNFMLRILAWKMLLSNTGVINSILEVLGLPQQNILNTPTAVVFCMVYDFLPFMVLPIYNAMARIGKDVLEAAQDLGAGKIVIFFKIIVPLTLSGVISGIIMVFVPALTSFAISDLLGGGKVLLIGNVIEQAFMQEYNWNLGSGLSFVLMFFVIISMALMSRHDNEGRGAGVW